MFTYDLSHCTCNIETILHYILCNVTEVKKGTTKDYFVSKITFNVSESLFIPTREVNTRD